MPSSFLLKHNSPRTPASHVYVRLTSKTASRWILALLAFSLLLPPLPFGNRLESCELLLYITTVIFYLTYRPVIDRIHVWVVGMVCIFFLIQISSISLGAVSGGTEFRYDRGDLSDLRRVIQLAASFLLFRTLGRVLMRDSTKMAVTIRKACLILFIPPLISTIQYLDVFGLKESITDIYKTVFLMESRELRLDYRVASVFQDSYTSGIFIGWSILFALYVVVKIKAISRVPIIIGCAVSYISLFYTLRTGMFLVPAGMCLMALSALFLDWKFLRLSINYFGVVAIGAAFLVSVLILNNASSFSWAMESLSIFGGGVQEIQSLYATQIGNAQTMAFIWNDPSIIFFPIHPDTTAENFSSGEGMGLFLDSFYFNGIIRYGIYIIIFYLATMYFLVRRGVRTNNHFIIALSILSVIISWKGSSGLLLTKAVIPLGFMLAASMLIASISGPASSGRAAALNVSGKSMALPPS